MEIQERIPYTTGDARRLAIMKQLMSIVDFYYFTDYYY